MGLFRSSSKSKSKDNSPALKSSRSNSLTSITSQLSNLSISKSITANSNTNITNGNDTKPKSPAPIDSNSEIDLISQRLKKRISTIVETNSEAQSIHSNETLYTSDESYYEEDELSNGSDDNDSDEDDHVNVVSHSHYEKSHSKTQRHSTLNALMNYCGIDYFVSNKQQLSELANQESKRTFSLLDESCKIYPIHDRHQTIINEPQVELIDRIRSTILQLKSQSLSHQYQILSTHKTLYSRFGVIKDILGKGSYGIIKIIDPNPNNVSLSNNVQHKLYAVKQFQHKKSPKESFDQYVNKILSEFIISCSLNCKHLVKSVDLMLTVPELSHRRQQSSDSLTSLPLSPSASPSRSSSLSRSLSPDSALLRGPSPMTTNDGINLITEQYYFSQVMECNRGGDLFAYLANTEEYPHSTMSLSEIDCFIKQIAKGLHYMHSHGAAHCDLKLENILINYKRTKSSDGPNKAKLILKISDFGRSYVFKTKWEKSEELVSKSKGPIGSLPYISPEEYDMSKSKEMALSKKDCWAFGILCLILFNIRKSYYDGDGFFPHINDDESNYKSNIDNNPRNSDDDTSDSNDDDSTDLIGNSPRTVFLWETTELKHHHRYSRKGQIYKDKNFEDYVNHRMIASYSDQTKEWIIQSEGTHKAIENLFTPSQSLHNDIDDNDLNQIRKMIIYKLLDIDPDTRMNMSHFLKSDWMDSVDNCIEYSE